MSNSLSKEIRTQLAKVTLAARERADQAVRAALENLAVHEKDYRRHMTVSDRGLRNRLRAKGRALGDERNERTGTQKIEHLADQAAYEHWHRFLFTRFLVENDLLYTDESLGSVPVTLHECDDLAEEAGAREGFDLACRFASRTLPEVFRQGDPVLELRLAPNDESELKRLLDSLPRDVFCSDDGLGWTYQFWQAKRKDDVNASGKKIGADELAAVTQLFTEDYMVEFLLHNTLGAWWAGKLGPIHAANEEEARAQASLPVKDGLGIIWTYLRFVEDQQTKAWSPAAGTFPGWPSQAKLITFLDPCMGSGHFLVFALPLLARMRMDEERLSAAQAVHATLHDNLFGLELDERCAQIGAFNLALTAWKLGGYQSLPQLHLACSGVGPHALENDWVSLSAGDDRLRRGMGRLYALFKDAPLLGSLINPWDSGGDLVEADFSELRPLLKKALTLETEDDNAHEMAVIASGLAKAAEILAGHFTVVATNVPYLGSNDQVPKLKELVSKAFPTGRSDLATCFLERCVELCDENGTTALVSPQSWLFIGPYRRLREHLLKTRQLTFVAQLGKHAFETISGEVVNVNLTAITRVHPERESEFVGLDVLDLVSVSEKACGLRSLKMTLLSQRRQMENPDARIVADIERGKLLLRSVADSYKGIATGDLERFIHYFWEHTPLAACWSPLQGRVDVPSEYGGREQVVRWENGRGQLYQFVSERLGEDSVGAWLRGDDAWHRWGVAIGQMTTLPCTLYLGDLFDENTAAVIPKDPNNLLAVWTFCQTQEYRDEVKKIDGSSLKIPNLTLTKVPFDLQHWRNVATKNYPQGLPKPFSTDPTQWLFNGHPKGSDQPLHVSMARLLGYQWPRQTESSLSECPALEPDGLEDLADLDGIVCLPPINREQPAGHRLREFLSRALGQCDERALLSSAGRKGSKSATLEDWLRDEFFAQHCDLFHQRPFIWHIWDGRKDGFHALVNYHRLDHATLQRLTYSYLGDWSRQQERDVKANIAGAAERLSAACQLQAELAKILEGEAPYDIFVRWKPFAKQALGWNPDLNDGVRLNIRPLMCGTDVGKKGAGLLRSKPGIKWDKDRGKEPHRDESEYPWFWSEERPDTDPKPDKEFKGQRWNDVHLTLGAKRAAR